MTCPPAGARDFQALLVPIIYTVVETSTSSNEVDVVLQELGVLGDECAVISLSLREAPRPEGWRQYKVL